CSPRRCPGCPIGTRSSSWGVRCATGSAGSSRDNSTAVSSERRPAVMYLDEEAVRAVLGWDQLIAEMETALIALSRGRVIQPTRSMITIEEDKRYLGIMPAVAEAAMGLKLVSFYPGNAGTGVPTHLATIVLFRPETGQPLAVLDGRRGSGRPGARDGLAASLLRRDKSAR